MKNNSPDTYTAVNILDFPSRPTTGRSVANRVGVPVRSSSLESIFGRLGNSAEWSYRIESAKFQNGYAVVIASLRTGRLVREGIGLYPANVGGSLENAERRALADAVSKFAVRPPERREEVSGGTEAATRRNRFASGPEAASLGDMISYSQLSRAKSLASGLSVSIDDESEKIFGCGLSELSRDAAEELIEMLEERASGPGRFMRAG